MSSRVGLAQKSIGRSLLRASSDSLILRALLKLSFCYIDKMDHKPNDPFSVLAWINADSYSANSSIVGKDERQ